MKHFLKIIFLTSSIMVLPSCAHHVLTVAEPDVTGDPVVLKTSAIIGSKRRLVINGDEDDGGISNPSHCDTNLLASVEVQKDFGQTLATIITLGAYSPITLTYHCSNIPTPNVPVVE